MCFVFFGFWFLIRFRLFFGFSVILFVVEALRRGWFCVWSWLTGSRRRVTALSAGWLRSFSRRVRVSRGFVLSGILVRG